jgi:uncharacterized delta-60 repeat protein
MKNIYLLFYFILLFSFTQNTKAQLRKTDSTFVINGGANSTVRHINIQSNGKIILTGEFNAYQGTLANRIVRLNTNGIVDTSFHSGFASEGPIRATALLPNDQIIIGGLFNSYNGSARKNIAKINSNGTLDTSYAKGIGANNEITDMYLQHDGKLLITGFFGKYNNAFLNGFLRLTASGDIDTTFKFGTGPNSSPNSFSQQSNGKILLVGSFVFYDGIPRNKIVRVNLNGSLDTTFVNNSISNSIQKILVLKNDEIIITGGFTNIAGVTKTGIARLHKDGQLDTAFKTYILGTVRGLHQQKDGKIIVSGDFTNVNGTTVQRLVRLNLDGTLDNTFYAGFNGSVYDIAEQHNRNIVLGGSFTQTTEVPTKTVASSKIVRLLNSYCVPPTAPKFNHTHAHVCKGDSLDIKIDEGELNDAQNWYWYTDSCIGTAIDSGASIKVKVNGNASYFVRAEKGCSNTSTPCVAFYVIMNDTLNTSLTSNLVYIESNDSNSTYQWFRCDSGWQLLQGETSKTIYPKDSGSYAVVLTSIDGCVDTSICLAFDPIELGISETRKLNIQNPIHSMLTIPLSYEIVELEIISMLGQTVIKANSIDAISEIPVATISTGIYYLRAKDRGNKTYSQKISIR